MNPIQTLKFVIEFAVNKVDLTRKEKNVIMNSMLDAGLSRRLIEVAQHEEEYKNRFTVADEEISPPTKGL